MAPPAASTTYKKQEGTLVVSKDGLSVSWMAKTAAKDAAPILLIKVSSITNLQQTPETHSKVMLKIFVQDKDQTDAVAHVFTFISPSSARGEANAIKDALAKAIQTSKASQTGDGATSGGSSAAMAIANAVSSGGSGGGRGTRSWDDDEKLKTDLDLQRSLLRENPELQRTFAESRKLKPESLSSTQFTARFWTSRVHLLRAHAIAKSQARGSYNVLSTLHPTSGDKKLSLSKEHVQLIFAQYPLVLRVYDNVVPKPYDEMAFWSRFFQSRLYKKLRGLKIDPHDPTDAVLDRYLDAEEFSERSGIRAGMQVPRIIDMEGNEENHSQRKGNVPYRELRPEAMEKVPIIRTLNSLSEKLMASVTPSDIDPSEPIGLDEKTYEQLRLQDLAGDPDQNRIILNIQDQNQFFGTSADATDGLADQATAFSVDPQAALQSLQRDLSEAFPQPGFGVIPLAGCHETGDDDQEAMEEEEIDGDTMTSPSVQATRQILDLIRQNRAQTEEVPASSGLSSSLYERVTLTHATTTEFLHQFWSAFLSGERKRADEIASLVESLNRALDRIESVAQDAESERDELVRKAKQEAIAFQQRTGLKRKSDQRDIPGGKKVVTELLSSTMMAVTTAIAKYKKALQEQIREAG